jgi:hypothetical protein
MIGVEANSLIRSVRVKPFIMGIIISSRMRFGLHCFATSIASWEFDVPLTSNPLFFSRFYSLSSFLPPPNDLPDSQNDSVNIGTARSY